MEKFKQLGLNEQILRSLKQKGYEKPTMIQELAIPAAIQGKDLIAASATGSGKTFAFGASIIQNYGDDSKLRALILTPTRELAEQIYQNMQEFSSHTRMKMVTIYGGVSINPQISKLKQAQVVIGTPGRILDHMERGTINLRNVKCLVLDEADRMLDMGFIDPITKIISVCPKDRQTLLFSATMSHEVKTLSKKFMKDPQIINAEVKVDPTKLRQAYYEVQGNMKFSLLVHLLEQESSELVMVFCNSRRSVDFVSDNLRANKIDATAIHGGLTQKKRTSVISKFNNQHVSVLVCTDVAARGLDIPGVSHVYNYDIPNDSKQYIHRIGRTARAGTNGIAISLLSHMDHDNFSRVLSENRIKIPHETTPKMKRVEVAVSKPSVRGGFSRGAPRHGGRGAPRGRDSRSSGGYAPRGRAPSRGRDSDMPVYGNRSESDSHRSSGGYNSRSSEGGSSRGYSRGPSRDSSRDSSGGYNSRSSDSGSSRGYSRGPSKDSSRGSSRGYSKGPSRSNSRSRSE